jgi:hypothetical protein
MEYKIVNWFKLVHAYVFKQIHIVCIGKKVGFYVRRV